MTSTAPAGDSSPSTPNPSSSTRTTGRWFASIGGRIVTVPGDDPVYGRWFSEHDATAALQRPDFHLYGTAASPAGTAALVEHLQTRLATQPTRQGVLL